MNDSEKRKQRNNEILAKLRNGESLSTIPGSATWFPPRPIIKKDLTKLYGKKQNSDIIPISDRGDTTENQ